MNLNPIYQERFEKLKQKFGCSDVELEALLRESNKSIHSNRLAPIESLIDQQLHELEAPRGRKIYAVDWTADEPVHRWERKARKYDDERLSAREIKELFDNVHPSDVRFSSMSSSSRARLKKLKKVGIKNRMMKLRQRIERGRQRPAQRLNRALRSLGRHGKREIMREGKRIARNTARQQLRRLVRY